MLSFSHIRFTFRGARFATLVVLVSSASTCTPAVFAQNPNSSITPNSVATKVLPSLQASPEVWNGAPIVLSLPPGGVPPRDAQLALFEAGRPVRIAQSKRAWQLINGRYQTQISVQADAGRYEWRLLQSDRARTPLTASAPLLVPGIARSPGWWLLDGSPFANIENQSETVGSAIPASISRVRFVMGLKRSSRDKKTAQTSNAFSLNGARTLNLPELSDAKAYESATLRAEIAARLAIAQSDATPILGWAIRSQNAVSDTLALSRLRMARAVVESQTPGAAIILEVKDGSAPQVLADARLIDAIAPECDAVWVRANAQTPVETQSDGAAWLLKVARRVAEEQAELDLPIFFSQSSPKQNDWRDLSALMNGATGIWNSPTDADNTASTSTNANWRAVIERNLPLFVGGVTLEDSGLLLPFSSPETSQSAAVASIDETAARAALSWFAGWRTLGRVPLLARGVEEARRRNKGERIDTRSGESFALSVAAGEAPATFAMVRAAIDGGARVLLQGNPIAPSDIANQNLDANPYAAPDEKSATASSARKNPLDSKNAPANWRELLMADSTPIAPRRTALTPENPWIFGTARGQSVSVEQSTIIKPTRTPTPDEENGAPVKAARKGEAKVPAPIVAARLEDGSPGVLIVPSRREGDERTGRVRGEIVWLPHAISPHELAKNPSSSAFFAALSASVQPSLVQLRRRAVEESDEVAPPVADVEIGVRVSPRGTLLVGVFNRLNQSRDLTLSAQAVADTVIDMNFDRASVARVRGLRVETDFTLPANGWKLFAFPLTRAAFDEERNAPRLKARLR